MKPEEEAVADQWVAPVCKPVPRIGTDCGFGTDLVSMEEQPGPVLDLEEETPTVLGTVRATEASGRKTGEATGPDLKDESL